MKILVIGGMHGNEPLGPLLVTSLQSNPIPGVDALIANPRAVTANTRFADQDLNRSFPGDPRSRLYEPRRASEIMEQAAGYDLILDFHNTLCSDNDCSFIGSTADRLLLRVSSLLGLKRIVVADYDCINKYLPNCISMEISVDSPRMEVDAWRLRIADLANLDTLPAPSRLKFYRYIHTVTHAERDALNLQSKKLRVFRTAPADVAAGLGLEHPAYPIFVGKNYTAGVYAGMLAPGQDPTSAQSA